MSSISQERKCGRMLLFAKHILCLELEKSLPGTTSSMIKFNDAQIVYQSVISLQIDCTLAEFEKTCMLAKTLAETKVQMHSRIPIPNSSRMSSSCQIVF
jgi:hypothetical protein